MAGTSEDGGQRSRAARRLVVTGGTTGIGLAVVQVQVRSHLQVI